jgi:DNA-binding protein HU-beta
MARGGTPELAQMTKAGIVDAVANNSGLTKVLAEMAVAAVIEALKGGMVKRGRIELRGFGVFVVKARKRGIGRNPRTGATVTIAPGRTVRFKPGKELLFPA